jgi:hypothetical protein
MARPAVTRTFRHAPACLREGTPRWNQALARAAPMPGATDGAMRALTTHHEGRNLLLRVFRTRRRYRSTEGPLRARTAPALPSYIRSPGNRLACLTQSLN